MIFPQVVSQVVPCFFPNLVVPWFLPFFPPKHVAVAVRKTGTRRAFRFGQRLGVAPRAAAPGGVLRLAMRYAIQPEEVLQRMDPNKVCKTKIDKLFMKLILC